MPPISLTDVEMRIVLAAAQPLTPRDRDGFLQAVAAELQKHSERGPGLVSRVCRGLQRQFFDAPDFTGSRGVAKHG